MYADKTNSDRTKIAPARSAHEVSVGQCASEVTGTGRNSVEAMKQSAGMIMPSDHATHLRNMGLISPNPNVKGVSASRTIDADVKEKQGSGWALPETVQMEMKKKLGGEYKDVRVHTDRKANEMANAVQAKAFTYGKDIYFAQGYFDTWGSEGKELLAHELLHTQENIPVIQREPLKTLWGEFEASSYEQKENSPGEKTVDMVLNFKPNKLIDANKIGLVQMVKLYKDGLPVVNGPVETARAINAKDSVNNPNLGQNEEGFMIDQTEIGISPLYAVNKARPGQMLKEGKTSLGRHGWRYDKNGKSEERTAWIQDVPDIIEGSKSSGEVFETTALAIDSKTQMNQYYGSVSWGWKWDKPNKPELLPLKVVSEGAASSTFMKAAQMWNRSSSSKGKETIDLPVQQFHNLTEQSDFYPGDAFNASNKTTIEAPQRVQLLNATPVKEMPDLVKVKIVEGSGAMLTGWMQLSKLEKENITVGQK